MWTALAGALLGLRHALEPDHVAAIGTLVEGRPRPLAAAAIGVWWGLGHALALGLAVIALVAVGAIVPEPVGRVLELGVAAMLVALGLRAMWRAFRADGPALRHDHDGASHVHGWPGPHGHAGRWTISWRPLLVGLAHGMAGSGAFTAAMLADRSTTGERLALLVWFGLGSTAGMALASGALGFPIALIAHRPGVLRAVAGAAGLVSTVVGLAWGWAQLA